MQGCLKINRHNYIAVTQTSRRYASACSLLILSAICMFFVNFGQKLTTPPLPRPLLAPMRLEANIRETVITKELTKLTAPESSFAIPETAEPPQAPQPVEKAPDAPRTKPKPAAKSPKKQPVAKKTVLQQTSAPTAPAAASRQPAQGEESAEAKKQASKQSALQLLVKEVERRKHYPKNARRTGAQGTVTLAISVGASGKVKSCSVAKSSGVAPLDQETIRLGEKLTGFDTGITGFDFTVHVPVRYSLQ